MSTFQSISNNGIYDPNNSATFYSISKNGVYVSENLATSAFISNISPYQADNLTTLHTWKTTFQLSISYGGDGDRGDEGAGHTTCSGSNSKID